jgi:hypothetical protein
MSVGVAAAGAAAGAAAAHAAAHAVYNVTATKTDNTIMTCHYTPGYTVGSISCIDSNAVCYTGNLFSVNNRRLDYRGVVSSNKYRLSVAVDSVRKFCDVVKPDYVVQSKGGVFKVDDTFRNVLESEAKWMEGFIKEEE